MYNIKVNKSEYNHLIEVIRFYIEMQQEDLNQLPKNSPFYIMGCDDVDDIKKLLAKIKMAKKV